MTTETLTLLVTIVTVLGQIITTWMMVHIKHATNGMKADLEAGKYAQGRRDQKAEDDAAC